MRNQGDVSHVAFPFNLTVLIVNLFNIADIQRGGSVSAGAASFD